MERIELGSLHQLPLVSIDTNHYWESNHWPAVGIQKATALGIYPGQYVIAHMDEVEAWLAVVRFDPTLEDSFAWWVELGEELDYETYVASRLANQ
jgi:hypothetical protein